MTVPQNLVALFASKNMWSTLHEAVFVCSGRRGNSQPTKLGWKLNLDDALEYSRLGELNWISLNGGCRYYEDTASSRGAGIDFLL